MHDEFFLCFFITNKGMHQWYFDKRATIAFEWEHMKKARFLLVVLKYSPQAGPLLQLQHNFMQSNCSTTVITHMHRRALLWRGSVADGGMRRQRMLLNSNSDTHSAVQFSVRIHLQRQSLSSSYPKRFVSGRQTGGNVTIATPTGVCVGELFGGAITEARTFSPKCPIKGGERGFYCA